MFHYDMEASTMEASPLLTVSGYSLINLRMRESKPGYIMYQLSVVTSILVL